MIKALILDIDGIVMGGQVGINFPLPSKKVTQYLKELAKTKIPICLCTGKTSFVVTNIIKHLQLDNYHITDGGALIYNPIRNKTLQAKNLDKDIVKQLINLSKDHLDYWQIYTQKSKYTLKNKFPDEFQEPGMEHTSLNNFEEIINNEAILKIELIYTPEKESVYRKIADKFKDNLSFQWTEVPVILPNKIIIITNRGVEKKNSVDFLLKQLQIDRKNVLSMGDTLMDWSFMNGSGYIATLMNAKAEMKELITQNNGFIGSHVNDDGLIEVLEHYKQHFYQ